MPQFVRRSRITWVFVALALVGVVALVPLLGGSSASATAPNDARAEHERIVAFWTHERVARAVPRDFVFEPGRGFALVKPDNPGNGNGNKGGGEDDPPDSGSSGVTGASWTAGGPVLETTGKVLFQLGSSYFVCSASVVSDGNLKDADALIVTAAHCAYDGGFATNWMFVPEYDSAPASLNTSGAFCEDTIHGCWTATALTVHDQWQAFGGFSLQSVPYDFAFATVYQGGHNSTALDATVGAQAIAFAELDFDTAAYAFGYPAAQKYKGKDLVYCAGPVGTDPNTGGATYRLECDMTGGSSGGPWFSPFDGVGAGTLTSVNSYGYRGDSGMFGPKFNGTTQAVFNAANGARSNGTAGS